MKHAEKEKRKRPAAPGPVTALFLFFERLNDNLWDLVKLNFLFLVSCIPVLTIGPALSALGICTDRMADEDSEKEEGLFSFYKRAFRSASRQALPLGIFAVFFSAVSGSAFFFYMNLADTRIIFVLPAAGILLLFLLAWCVLIHAFPICGARETGALLVKQAARQALLTLPRTLGALICMLVLLLAQVLGFPALLPLTLALGFSVPAFIGSVSVGGRRS